METARNEPVCLATAVRELVLQAVFFVVSGCVYRAAPRRKAVTVALVTPNKPNSRCTFAAVCHDPP